MQRSHPNALQQTQLSELVDVIALSRVRCERPILVNLVYATHKNFIGRTIDGYTPGVTDLALLTKESAQALCDVQNALLTQHGVGLFVYDSYRPKRAVKDFMLWSNKPVAEGAQGQYELERKAKHYPHLEKTQLFDHGYVAEDSQHCYGNTVDLVLVDSAGNELTMGARFDFMDPLSHLSATADVIGEDAVRHRSILSQAMQEAGFIPYPYEFWHFSYAKKSIQEPMDIVITSDLRGWNVA